MGQKEINWKRCKFDQTGGLAPQFFPPGSLLYALSVNFEERTLILHTRSHGRAGPDASPLERLLAESRGETGDEELKDVRFVGVVAHELGGITTPVKIATFRRVAPGELWYVWEDLFTYRRPTGWPFEYADLDALCEQREEMEVVGFDLVGVGSRADEGIPLGFVVAKRAEYCQPPEAGKKRKGKRK